MIWNSFRILNKLTFCTCIWSYGLKMMLELEYLGTTFFRFFLLVWPHWIFSPSNNKKEGVEEVPVLYEEELDFLPSYHTGRCSYHLRLSSAPRRCRVHSSSQVSSSFQFAICTSALKTKLTRSHKTHTIIPIPNWHHSYIQIYLLWADLRANKIVSCRQTSTGWTN